MGFSRQEYWSGLPFPSPGDLPDPRIEPVSPALEADALTFEPPGKHLVSKSCPILSDPIHCSTPGTATSLPCPSLSPRVCSNSCSLSQWCCLTILSSVALFSFCLGENCSPCELSRVLISARISFKAVQARSWKALNWVSRCSLLACKGCGEPVEPHLPGYNFPGALSQLPCVGSWDWLWWHFLDLAISSHSICLFSSPGQKVLSVNYWETHLFQRVNDSQGLVYYSSSEPLQLKGDNALSQKRNGGISGRSIPSVLSSWHIVPVQCSWLSCLILLGAAIFPLSSFVDDSGPWAMWMTIQLSSLSVSWSSHSHWPYSLFYIGHFHWHHDSFYT